MSNNAHRHLHRPVSDTELYEVDKDGATEISRGSPKNRPF